MPDGRDVALTAQECALALDAGKLWDAFLQLPVEHPCDRDEFCRAIHAVQSMILMRPTRRSLNSIAPS